MKLRIFLIVLALVVVVHALLFFLPQTEPSSDRNPPPEANAPVETKLSQDSPTTAPIQKVKETDSEEGENESASRAIGLVKRADASTSRSSRDEPLSPGVEPSKASDPIKIGIVTGNSKLTPELRELAREGAEAVAVQNWKVARDIYLEMVQKAPDNALSYANLGVSEHQLGNLLAAAGNLQKSLELNPSIAQNWQTLGLIHFKRGELELAISHLTRSIHEDPSDARSRLYLAAVVREYGWADAAVRELQRAVETDPNLADAHYNLAISYLDETPARIELARRHYYSAIDLGTERSPEIEEALALTAREKKE